jgi:SAM-dependent methyltransferase
MGVLTVPELPAALYDAIHEVRGKDYGLESLRLLEMVALGRPGATSLLDVACGTGRHLQHLSHSLECAGLDADAGMLALARLRCPDLSFTQADMVDFDLGRHFDVVTCLFSAIGYVATEERLDRSVACMAKHLSRGGLLIVEPWFQPEEWSDGIVNMNTVDQPELKAVRMNISRRQADVAVLDFHWLVGTPQGIESFVEHHELALFTWDQYRAAFERAGLEVEVDKRGLSGRGLVVGRKR